MRGFARYKKKDQTMCESSPKTVSEPHLASALLCHQVGEGEGWSGDFQLHKVVGSFCFGHKHSGAVIAAARL